MGLGQGFPHDRVVLTRLREKKMSSPHEKWVGEPQQQEGRHKSAGSARMDAIFGTAMTGPDATAYSNADVLPLPPSRRTWGKTTFVFFWISTGERHRCFGAL